LYQVPHYRKRAGTDTDGITEPHLRLMKAVACQAVVDALSARREIDKATAIAFIENNIDWVAWAGRDIPLYKVSQLVRFSQQKRPGALDTGPTGANG